MIGRTQRPRRARPRLMVSKHATPQEVERQRAALNQALAEYAAYAKAFLNDEVERFAKRLKIKPPKPPRD